MGAEGSHSTGQGKDAALIRRAYAGKLMPGEQIELLRNKGWLFAQRPVRCGDWVRPLPAAASTLTDLTFAANGQTYDLFDYVSRNRVAGLMIIKDGRVLLEHYELGNTPATPWVSMSVAKSIAATLVGAAVKDGYIRSLDELLTRYLPELAGQGYDGVTLRQVLQMSVGLRWDETHTVETSERREMLELQIAQESGIIVDYLARRPRFCEPGAQWLYATGEAHMLGTLLKAATGQWAADYLAEKIWGPAGMESPTTWWLDSPGGVEVTGSGINATLRDYARFGLFALEGGMTPSGPILPDNWMAEATAPQMKNGERVPYGYMWWLTPGADGELTDGAYSARGIFGQYIYINPAHQLVVVVNSARSKPQGAEAFLDNDFFNGVVAAVR